MTSEGFEGGFSFGVDAGEHGKISLWKERSSKVIQDDDEVSGDSIEGFGGG
jgi:hypothetical protein